MTAPPERDAAPGRPPSPAEGEVTEVRARIAALEREAKALEPDPRSARLYHELGLLWERPLGNLRAAAAAFQAAYRIAPRFVENLRSARRIFADVGNWPMVLQLLDAELAATEGARPRAALLFEKAEVLSDRLDRWDEATEVLAAALELEPADLGLLVQAEGMLAAHGDVPGLLRVQILLARALPDARLAAHALQTAAALHQRLGQREEALGRWREAFALDRRDPVTLGALRRAAEIAGDDEALIAVLAAEAELGGATSVPAYTALARAYVRQERPEDAVAALNAARHQNPGDTAVLTALATLHESLDRPEELANVLTSLSDSVRDEREWLTVQLRLASLLEDTLHRDTQAVQRYEAVLQRVPGHVAALAGLGRLHAKTQDWPALVAVYDAELAGVGDPRTRAELHFRSAEILDGRLHRTDDALARFREALQLVPGYLPARQGLERVLRREQRWTELIALHEEELLSITSPADGVAALGRIAQEAEEHLGNLDLAADALRRALDLAPDHLQSLVHLARLTERREAWDELVPLLERQAELSSDASQAIALRHRAAQVLEERLNDPLAATDALERLLRSDPTYLPALQSLGRLYAREGRWKELGQMYRREAGLAGPARAVQLWARIAELEESRLLDLDAARAAWDEVLRRDADHGAALRALSRIQRDQGDWAGLVGTLQRMAQTRTDPRSRADALFEVATLQLDALADRKAASETLDAVLRLAPDHVPALRELEALAGREAGADALQPLERATVAGTPAERLAARLRLANALLAAGHLDRAAAVAESALELQPDDLGALLLLEHTRAGDRARRAEVRQRLAARVHDPALAAALKLSAELEHGRPRLEERLEHLRRAFAVDPEDPRTAFQLERALRQSGDVEGLRELYERRLTVTESAEGRLELHLRLGQLGEAGTDSLPLALAAYQAALALEPADLVALQGIRRVRLRMGDSEAAALAWEAEAAATRSREGAVEAWLEVGRLWMDALKQPERAIDAFERVLDLDPLEVEAAEAVESLLARKGGAAELASLNERRGQTRLASGDRPGAAEEFFKAAQGWLEGVGDRGRALTALGRALEAEPEHGDALDLRAVLATEQGRWAEAAEALEGRLRIGGDAETLAGIQLRLGILYQEHLDQPARAVAAYNAALASVRSAEPLDRLATLHRASRNWTGVVDCLQQLRVMAITPAERARAALRLAEALDEGFDDAERALSEAREALPILFEDTSALDRIVPLFERRGRMTLLLQLLDERAQPPCPPAAAARIRVRLAELYLRTLGDLSRSVAACRTAVELDPTSVEARAALADMLSKDPGSADLAVDAHRAVLALDPVRLLSLETLFEIWDSQRLLDRTFCCAAASAFLLAGPARATHLHLDWRGRLPTEPHARVDGTSLELMLHPDARNPLSEVLRVVGDHLARLYPPDFEPLGVDPRADRLRADHPISRAVALVAEGFGVDHFDVYQARRGLMVAETSEPPCICVGQDVVRRFNSREQKFLIGRAVFALLQRTALAGKLPEPDLADLLGDCIRVVVPDFEALGRRDDARIRNLRKVLPRKALRALEDPARELAGGPVPDLGKTLQGLFASGNRAGLLVCGDPAVALTMVLREDPAFTASKAPESQESILRAVRERADLRALVTFSVSEELFTLRERVGPTLPERAI
ncbi:MAG TPA: tetratricopeptide repeat protein [Myxococcaceae bacterium]|nr:tetratricopeptide repeat protein [Myxococcaceae bacterium]